MNAQNKQLENYLEFAKEIVQKTLELCHAQQAEKERKLQISQKN